MCISLMDVIVKWSVDYPIGQVLFFRGFWNNFLFIILERLHDFIKQKTWVTFSKMCIGLIALVAIFIALKVTFSYCCEYIFCCSIFTKFFQLFTK